ncbi:MAG: hypothetical protein HY607_06095 [Planctomycetes bacterium]|nr:hypothetical protein [Planctomycetota bacterium]
MLKTIYIKYGLKSILTVWFFLCILPGDCFVLGCVEKDLFHCDQKESVIISQNDADSSIPQSNPHCQNCCVLCANNLVLHVFQDSSFTFTNTSSRFKTQPFNHFKNIFQTSIYHPPRLAA